MFDAEMAEARVRVALQTYPDDPSGLPEEQAAAGFAQLQRISEAVEAKRLRWLADQARRASYRKDGYLSSAAWLASRFKVAAGSAKEQVRVAQALEEMPEVRDSFFGGTVTSGAVRVLAEARGEHPEAFAAQETALVEAAMTRPVEDLRRVVGEWSQALDEQGALDRAETLRARRRLDVCPTPTHMVRVEGELDPEGGEAVLTALQAMVDADLRTGRGGDVRTPAQRRADALCELAYRYLQSPDRPTVAGERPHVTLTMDVEALRGTEESGTKGGSGSGRCELDHAGAVHPESARRLVCDASVRRVLMAGPSEPLEVGRRTPVVSAGLRRGGRPQGPTLPIPVVHEASRVV